MTPPEPIYVLYRPLPATLLALVLAVAGSLAGLAMGVAAAAAWGQPDPGPGVWDTANAATLTGHVAAHPYPMLLPHDGSAGVLLVGVGKVGPPEAVLALVGHGARVTGYPLERGGLKMLEVQETTADHWPSPAPGPAVGLGVHAIATEILDSKCYLGAMKPGHGPGHKACAILCITGGIPPMIAWTDAAGRTHHALVTGPDGGPMPEAWRPRVADRVVVRGRLTSRDGWLWMAADAPDP